MLVAPTERDLSVSLFDMQLSSPLFMPPVGVVGVLPGLARRHPGGSSLRTDRCPDGGVNLDAGPDGRCRPARRSDPNLFQLYTSNDKELAASFVHRAEQSGYKAIVVTLDTWITGWRPHDLNMANFPQLRGYCLQTISPMMSSWRGCPNHHRTILRRRPWSGRRSLAIQYGGTTSAGCAH